MERSARNRSKVRTRKRCSRVIVHTPCDIVTYDVMGIALV
jgi:hypothetical protein